MVEKPKSITNYLVKIIPLFFSQADSSLTSLYPGILTSFLCVILRVMSIQKNTNTDDFSSMFYPKRACYMHSLISCFSLLNIAESASVIAHCRFLFTAAWCSTVWRYHRLFNQFPTDSQWVISIFAISNKAVMNNHTHTSLICVNTIYSNETVIVT